MTPRKNGQKLKRSTATPRAGSKRTAPKVPTPAPRPEIEIDGQAQGISPVAPPATDIGPEAQRDRAHRWSITYPTRERLFKDQPTERRPGSLEEFHPAALEQFEALRQAVMQLLDSGAFGDGEVVVTIAGHGNTDHRPVNGLPNDRGSISINGVGS